MPKQLLCRKLREEEEEEKKSRVPHNISVKYCNLILDSVICNLKLIVYVSLSDNNKRYVFIFRFYFDF